MGADQKSDPLARRLAKIAVVPARLRNRITGQAKAGVGQWITFYNHERPHAANGGQPPAVKPLTGCVE